jgi:hypothetical protein
MVRKRSDTGWRAASLAAALFAITLNFLQPLAHAALMRDAGSMASSPWAAMCLPSAGLGTAQDGGQSQAPTASKMHECCLGLAHAPAIAQPSAAFVLVEPLVAAVHIMAEVDALSPVGIRDGPSQPRAPPLPV